MSSNKDVKNPNVAWTQMDVSESTWFSILLHHASVYGIAAGYCFSSSLLLIINKWAVMKFPHPGALTALQYLTGATGVFICGQLKFLEHEPLDLLMMWRFILSVIIFYLSLFTNSELLLHANVDMFIVFRSVVPMYVAAGETLFLHQLWGLPVGLSCIFGLAISFFGFSCRRAISATGCTVLRIVNKLLTVINHVIWDKHSKVLGTIGLLICTLEGVMYPQSTTKPKAAKELQEKQGEEEQQKLLEMQPSTQQKDNDDQQLG